MMNEFGFFPSFYPDELVYSLFARYHIRSGNMYFRETSSELFGKVLINLETEFIDTLTPQAKNAITRTESMESVIFNHTMFNQYARFLTPERRKQAFDSFMNMSGNYSSCLIIQRKEADGCFLRYCHVCAKEDREKYGETYWHRKHQLRGIDICPVHHCKLHNSSVNGFKKRNTGLICAENEAINKDVVVCENPLEIQLAEYVWSVFQLPVSLENKVDISKFMNSKLEGTRYLSVRGESRKLTLLTSDFQTFYQGYSKEDLSILEGWQIEKIFTGYRRDLLGICQLGMFLGINPDEFVQMILPKRTQYQLFDEKVKALHEQGIGYNRIARMLKTDSMTIRKVFMVKQTKPDRPRKKSGAKPKDWNKLDIELLPKVEQTVNELYETGSDRPRRIRVTTICTYLNLPSKTFDRLPLCRGVILSKEESQEQYWAREVVWALDEVERQNTPLCWRRIRDLTNMKKAQFQSCLRYVTDDEVRARLELLV